MPVPDSDQRESCGDPKVHKVSAVELIDPKGDKVCGGNKVVAPRKILLVFLRFFHLAL